MKRSALFLLGNLKLYGGHLCGDGVGALLVPVPVDLHEAETLLKEAAELGQQSQGRAQGAGGIGMVLRPHRRRNAMLGWGRESACVHRLTI